jgi:hypothetical protein
MLKEWKKNIGIHCLVPRGRVGGWHLVAVTAGTAAGTSRSGDGVVQTGPQTVSTVKGSVTQNFPSPTANVSRNTQTSRTQAER